MSEPLPIWSRINEIKKWSIIGLSLLYSCGLVGVIIAAGMFGGSGETEVEFSRRITLWALAGGCACGFLWGGGSLRHIFLVAVPGAVWLGLLLLTLPFLLFDLLKPSDAGGVHDLLDILSIIVMCLSIMIFPLLGPLISHAVWNGKGPSQMRADLGAHWKEFKIRNRQKDKVFRRPEFERRPEHRSVFDRIPYVVKVIIATVLLGLMFSFLPSLFL
jgi:hypothetical protein